MLSENEEVVVSPCLLVNGRVSFGFLQKRMPSAKEPSFGNDAGGNMRTKTNINTWGWVQTLELWCLLVLTHRHITFVLLCEHVF